MEELNPSLHSLWLSATSSLLIFLLVKCCGILSLLQRREIYWSSWVLSCEDNMAMVALATGCSWILSCRICPQPYLQFSFWNVPDFKHWIKLHLETLLELCCHRCSCFSSPLWEMDFLWSCWWATVTVMVCMVCLICVCSLPCAPEVGSSHSLLAHPLDTLKAGKGGMRGRVSCLHFGLFHCWLEHFKGLLGMIWPAGSGVVEVVEAERWAKNLFLLITTPDLL